MSPYHALLMTLLVGMLPPPGPIELQTWWLDDNGHYIWGPYYVYVTQTSQFEK